VILQSLMISIRWMYTWCRYDSCSEKT